MTSVANQIRNATGTGTATWRQQPRFYGDVDELEIFGRKRTWIRSEPRDPLMQPIYVKANDVKIIDKFISGNTDLEVTIRNLKKDKLDLHERSVARVRNWSNTIGGQQRAKVQARQERMAKREAELQVLDKEFADEENRRRKAAVERARKILFFQGDRQREFHRQLLLSEVLKERDLQIKLKNHRREEQKRRDMKLELDIIKANNEGSEQEALAKQQAFETAKTLSIQLKTSYEEKEKINADEKRKTHEEERKMLKEISDQVEIQNLLNKEKEAESKIRLRSELDKLVAQKKAEGLRQKEKEAALHDTAIQWQRRKDELMALKSSKNLQKQAKLAELQQKMGQIVAYELDSRKQALDSWVVSQRSAFDLQTEENERLRKEMIQQDNEDMLIHMAEERNRHAMLKQAEIDDKLRERQRLERLSNAAQELKLSKDAECRNHAREIMEYQLKQKKMLAEAKNAAGQAAVNNEERMISSHEQEDAEYASYAQSIRSLWEQKGRSTVPLERCMPKPPRVPKTGADTFARLGMAPLKSQAIESKSIDQKSTGTDSVEPSSKEHLNQSLHERIINNPVGWAESVPRPPEQFNPISDDLYPKVHTRSSLPEVPRPRMWSELEKLRH